MTDTGKCKKRGRKPLYSTHEAKRRRTQILNERGKTRVMLGGEFGRWRELRMQLGLKSDVEMAKMLLDCYFKHQFPSSESGKSTNQRPPSTQALHSQTSLNSAVLSEDLDTRSSEITSVRSGDAFKSEPLLSMTCDEYGSSSDTCDAPEVEEYEKLQSAYHEQQNGTPVIKTDSNDQQDFDQTQVETRQLQNCQTTQRNHLDLPYSAISSSPKLPLHLGSGAAGKETSSLVPGASENGTCSKVPDSGASANGKSSNVPANPTVEIKTEVGAEVEDADTHGLPKDTCTDMKNETSESLVSSIDNDVKDKGGMLEAERKTVGEETEVDSENSGKENSSVQCSQDVKACEFQRHIQPDCNKLTQFQTLVTKRQYGKTHVEDSVSMKNLDKSSSLKKAQDAGKYKKRPRMVRFEDEVDDKTKRTSSRLKNKGFRIDYADYDELKDISDLESESIESESDCLDNMLEESVESVDGGSNESNSSLKPKESVKPTDDASNESNASIQLEESVEPTDEASIESNSSIQLVESVEPTDEAGNESNSSIQSNENANSVKSSIGKRHIEEDPDFDPEEFNGNKKRKKNVKKAPGNKKRKTDVKKAPKGTNIPPAGPGNELEDLPEAIDKFKTVDMMKLELEKRKNRIKVTLENHKDLFYEEEVVSLQRKDRAKSQEDITTVLLVCAVCKKYKTGNKTGLEMHLEQHLNGDFDCDKCDEKFESSYLLKLHMSEAHALSAKQKKKNKNKKKFKCPECNLDFRISHSLREHMGTVHGKTAVPCKVCFEIYPSPSELREHTKQMHKETMSQCDSCSDFFSRKGLRSHKEMCGNVGNVSCEICGKQVSPAGLRAHLKHVHENVRLHNCPSCSYTAKTPNRLRLHIKSLHTGEHTYRCDQCTFTCVQKIQFTSHMRTHTGEKPYKCDLCPYAAAWNVQLKDHRKLHGLPFTVTCEECGILVKDKKCLNRHKTKEHKNC